jgi:hypothetical protein
MLWLLLWYEVQFEDKWRSKLPRAYTKLMRDVTWTKGADALCCSCSLGNSSTLGFRSNGAALRHTEHQTPTRISYAVCSQGSTRHTPPRCTPPRSHNTRPWWRGPVHAVAVACGLSGTRGPPPHWGTGVLHRSEEKEFRNKTWGKVKVKRSLCITKKSCDSSGGIALGYGLHDRGSEVRFPAGTGNFSLHSASYPMGTRGSFLDLDLMLRSKNVWNYTSTPPIRLNGVVLS